MSFTPDMFGGDVAAAQLLNDLSYVSHVWDDLIDKDKERTATEINDAFERMLIGIPNNSFFLQHRQNLTPIMYTGIIGFLTANEMEKSNDTHSLEIAHGLRYAIGNAAAYAVAVTNPRGIAISILETAWKGWLPERISDYIKEHSHAD